MVIQIMYPIRVPVEYKNGLHYYQTDAANDFINNGMRGTIKLPTGTGKTAVALEIVRRLRIPTAILVPRISLLEQWEDVIESWGGSATGFYCKRKALSDLTLWVYNSAHIHPQELEKFKFLIFDEAHYLTTETNKDLLVYVKNNPNVKALGLSATPRENEILPIVYSMEMDAAKEGGFVSQLTIVGVPSHLSIQEQEAYNNLSTVISSNLQQGGGWSQVMSAIDPFTNVYSSRQASRKYALLRATVQRKLLMSKILSKYEKLAEICERYKGEPIMVFSESIDAIEMAKEYLKTRGIEAHTYHSRKGTDDRSEILRFWGHSFNVLLSVRCLDEGIDIPEVAVGIVMASGRSEKQLIQRTGRLIRPYKGKSMARMYVIYGKDTNEASIPTKLTSLTNAKYVEVNS